MKRLVSVILVFIMMLGCFPLHAAAASAATVTTLEPEDTRATSVKMVGTFETLLSEVVTEYGFEYYEVKKTGAKNITAVPVETGVKISSYKLMEHRYSLVIDGLKQNTKYAGRAYIKLKSSKTPLRGKDFTFTTVETKPTIRLMSSSCSSDGSFHAKGFVTSKVTDGIVEYGFAYGTSADTPVKYPLAVSDGAALVLSRKEFTATVKGLEPGTEYYVRAYAARSDGKTDYSASAGKLTTKDYTAALKLDADHITATEDPNYVRGMGITYRYDKSFYSIGSVALNYRYGDLPYTSVEMKKQTGSSSYRASIGKLLGGERYEYYLTVTSDAGTEYDSPVFSFEPEIILADSLEVWISHGISTRKAKSETFYLNTKAKVQARISPANADDRRVRWVSSDESVAYVEDGYVVCAGAGKATITAFTEYRGEKNLSYSFNVTVKPEAAYGPGPVITGGISVTDSTVSLSWKRPADFWSTDKVVYIFERADGKEGPYRSFGTATANTSFTLHNLDPETHYYFRFIAWLKKDTDYRKFSDWTYFEAITAEETAKKKERVSKQSGSTDVISVVPDKTVASTADVITYTVTTGTGVNGGVRLECGGYVIGEIAAKDKRASTSTQNVYKPTSRFTSGGAKEVRAYALDENGEPIRTENKYAVCVVNINADGKVDMVGSLNANAGAAGEDVAVSFSKPANVSSGKVFYNIYVIAPDGGRICAKDFYESSAKSVSCAVDGAFFPSAGTYKIEVYAIVNGRNNSDGQGISVTVKSGAPAGSGQEGSVPAEPEKNVKPLVTGLESSYTAVVGVPLDLSFTVTDPVGGKVEKVTVKNNTKGGEVLGTFDGQGGSALNCPLHCTFKEVGTYEVIVYARTENFKVTDNICAKFTIKTEPAQENAGSAAGECVHENIEITGVRFGSVKKIDSKHHEVEVKPRFHCLDCGAYYYDDNYNYKEAANHSAMVEADDGVWACSCGYVDYGSYKKWTGYLQSYENEPVYTEHTLKERDGSMVYPKDQLVVIGEKGEAYLVRYPLDKGGYKYRFIGKDKVDKYPYNGKEIKYISVDGAQLKCIVSTDKKLLYADCYDVFKLLNGSWKLNEGEKLSGIGKVYSRIRGENIYVSIDLNEYETHNWANFRLTHMTNDRSEAISNEVLGAFCNNGRIHMEIGRYLELLGYQKKGEQSYSSNGFDSELVYNANLIRNTDVQYKKLVSKLCGEYTSYAYCICTNIVSPLALTASLVKKAASDITRYKEKVALEEAIKKSLLLNISERQKSFAGDVADAMGTFKTISDYTLKVVEYAGKGSALSEIKGLSRDKQLQFEKEFNKGFSIVGNALKLIGFASDYLEIQDATYDQAVTIGMIAMNYNENMDLLDHLIAESEDEFTKNVYTDVRNQLKDFYGGIIYNFMNTKTTGMIAALLLDVGLWGLTNDGQLQGAQQKLKDFNKIMDGKSGPEIFKNLFNPFRIGHFIVKTAADCFGGSDLYSAADDIYAYTFVLDKLVDELDDCIVEYRANPYDQTRRENLMITASTLGYIRIELLDKCVEYQESLWFENHTYNKDGYEDFITALKNEKQLIENTIDKLR